MSGRILRPEEAFAPFVPPLTIELTSLCNLKCPYCANPTLQREYGEMPTDMIFRLADECARDGHEVLYVHGIGEPLLRKDTEVILARFNELGIWRGSLCTNGTLLTARRMEGLVAAGLKSLYVSVDTLDADLYRRTRGGKLSKVLSNIRTAAAMFPDVDVTVALMNHKEQVVDASVTNLFYEYFGATKNVRHLTVENGKFPGAAEDWRRIDQATGVGKMGEECWAWASYCTIAIDGRVSVCCADQQAEEVIGNVATASINDIWFSETTQSTFRSIALGLGGCPAVCYKCQIKPTTRQLSEADPLLAGPYYAVRSAVHAARKSGDHGRALALLQHMKQRNPWDKLLDIEIAAGTSA